MRFQKENMRRLFESRPNQRIPLYEVMRIAAQYNARIHDLRLDGMNIVNHVQVVNGTKHSWFEYRPFGELFGAAGFSSNTAL